MMKFYDGQLCFGTVLMLMMTAAETDWPELDRRPNTVCSDDDGGDDDEVEVDGNGEHTKRERQSGEREWQISGGVC